MVSLSVQSLNRFHGINGTCMNSLSYLPCFAFIENASLWDSSSGLAECTPFPSLPPAPSVCTEPAQIHFYCIYLFIYSYLFSISEASYQRPANLRSRVAGEPWVYICVCTCMSVSVLCDCVCVFQGIGIKLKHKQKGNIGIITFVIACYTVYSSHC